MYETSFSFSAPSRQIGNPTWRPRYRKNPASFQCSAIPLMRSSTFSTSVEIACGMARSSVLRLAMTSGSSFPRSSATFRANRYIAATCATNVLVAATPISRPARVKSTPSASRVAWLPWMFVMASTVAPRSRARRIAARVSAVSPDWEIPITRSCSSITGFR